MEGRLDKVFLGNLQVSLQNKGSRRLATPDQFFLRKTVIEL